MVDFSQLFGTTDPNMGGLLSPAQQGDVNQTTLQSIAAGLMKASGPSPYKPGMTALSGIGDALQGGIAARNAAQTAALNQSLVRAKTLEGLAPLLKIQQDYAAVGIPLPPNYQRVIDSLTSVTTGGRMGSGVPGAPGAAGAPAAPAAAPPQNAILKAAQELNISPFNLIPSSPGYETAMARIGEHIKANDPALEAAQRRQKISDSDIARSEKAYPAFAQLGQLAHDTRNDAQLSLALANDPNFTSGVLQPFSEAWQKFKVAFGGDPNEAFSQEAFRKITAANVGAQIQQMKAMQSEMGGAAGRVFQSQIDLYQKASQSLGNTPAANKFLANLQLRVADQNEAISDMAIKYKQDHGILDAGFDKQLSDFLKEPKNQLYTKEELGNLRKVIPAAATAPATPTTPGPPILPSGRPTGPAPVPGSPPTAGAANAAPMVAPPVHTDGKGNFVAFVNGAWVPSDATGAPLGK
jgi:hypothetical protein